MTSALVACPADQVVLRQATTSARPRNAPASRSMSDSGMQLPVGLLGVLRITARVRELKAAANSPASNFQSGGFNLTKRGTAPQMTASGA